MRWFAKTNGLLIMQPITKSSLDVDGTFSTSTQAASVRKQKGCKNELLSWFADTLTQIKRSGSPQVMDLTSLNTSEAAKVHIFNIVNAFSNNSRTYSITNLQKS